MTSNTIVEPVAVEAANNSSEAASPVPPDKLIGQKLLDGWEITRRLPRSKEPGGEELTGGHFSIGYIATKKGKDGKAPTEAFLKVIDVESALQPHPGTTLMQRLKCLADSHTFECAILDICDKASLDRIVRILGKGELPPQPGMPTEIPFILFELADGDVRKVIAKSDKLDDAWRLRVLHDSAVGIQQLHSQDIAHQDLKPSNVLIFNESGKRAKLGDLGRASSKGLPAGHDTFDVAGARSYAPPEQLYAIVPSRWEDRRQGCDLYHLGSLAMFMFTGITPTAYYIQNVSSDVRPKGWGGKGLCDYSTALPVLIAAFSEMVESIKVDFPDWARDELAEIVINACNPDYNLRGDPDSRKRSGSPIGIETFVSRFDRLAKKAVVELKK